MDTTPPLIVRPAQPAQPARPAQRGSVHVAAARPVAELAYADLFVEHRDAVLRLAALLVGDRHVAEEITAEVFAKVLPRWRRQELREPLAYLRRVTVNEANSRFRRLRHERRAAERHRSDALVDVDVGAVGDGARWELREPLVAALAALPPRQRAVVVLRFHDDLSEQQVAAILGSSVGTVKSQASRGLVILRELLEATS